MENLNAKTVAKVWEFESSSSSKRYQTLQYTDGYVSCNCPGWTRRAVRECKHTRMVEMGTADHNCVAMKDKTLQTAATPAPVPQVAPAKPKTKKNVKAPGLRKVRWKEVS